MTSAARIRAAAALLAAAAAIVLLATGTPSRAADPVRVISLTQTACQFLEPESRDQGFRSSRKSDCEAINERTAEQRLAQSQTLELEPGRYVFRVTNRDVPYELGFWLRGEGLLGRATLPSVSGGELFEGKSRDYEIELQPGTYVYSCPLNPTPSYRVVVKG